MFGLVRGESVSVLLTAERVVKCEASMTCWNFTRSSQSWMESACEFRCSVV